MINSSQSFLRTPAVHYILSWQPSIWMWRLLQPIACCCLLFLHPVQGLFLKCSSWHIAQWVQLQHCSGQTGVCAVAECYPGAHRMKHPPFGSIEIVSHRTEVFLERWLAFVEKVRKMIMKTGKFWGIYRKLQVTKEWLIVKFHRLLKVYLAANCGKLQAIPTVPWFAVSKADDICLFVCRDTLKWTTADILCLIDIKKKF